MKHLTVAAWSLLAVCVVFLLAIPRFSVAGTPPEWRIGILGDPMHQVPWTDDALERLKDVGFNAVQLNIAWGNRPFDEPLNLVDVVTLPGETVLPGTGERRAALKMRAALAKQHGLRTLFHFGSPYMDRNPYTGYVPRIAQNVDSHTFDSWYDINNPKVRKHELALLKEFRRQFPDVDDILVYTYDQDAWQTPEFQFNKFSYAIPLVDRLPSYLADLHRVWTEGRSGQVMWWEPWELSAGEVYAILPQLPRSDFGLIIHANIAEAQIALPVDVWFRNTVRICKSLGIPVIAESFFASATEEIEPLVLPAVRLVDEEYLAFLAVPGVVGIKEYYGINTTIPDLSLDLLKERLRGAAGSTDQLVSSITERFGAAQHDVQLYLGLLSDALQTYPWDATWHGREVGRASPDHGWQGAAILGAMPSTPSWDSTRHARFMKTDDLQPSFWMREDAQLRCALTANLLDRADEVSARLLLSLAAVDDKAQFESMQTDADRFKRNVRSFALHLRETNVAELLRQDLSAGRPMSSKLVKELTDLLDNDVVNQQYKGRVVEMKRLFTEDPKAFVQRYLIPVDAGAGPAIFGPGFFNWTTR